MWLDIIFSLCEKFNIKHTYNKSLQRVTFENKSSITLTGAGATDNQIEKALGGKYKLVIFDECQIIQNDLERWIKSFRPCYGRLKWNYMYGRNCWRLYGRAFLV
jgi:superfamily II DNA or RNA helicase